MKRSGIVVLQARVLSGLPVILVQSGHNQLRKANNELSRTRLRRADTVDIMRYALLKVSTMRWTDRSNENSLRCSFCGKSQKNAGKLISSPRDSPRAYICDECVAICAAIIEDDKIQPEIPQPEDLCEGGPSHPLLAHPLASDLMEAIERWVREQSLGNDGLLAMAEVRRIASGMLSESRHRNDAQRSRL
jgi:hypothetical protein